jgi:hypothetical protein
VVGLYLNPPEHALVLCCDDGRPGAPNQEFTISQFSQIACIFLRTFFGASWAG